MAAREVEFAHVNFELPGGRQLLRDVSLKVNAGETVALLGRSGSGKTTLLRTVNGLVKPTSGQVLVGEQDIGQQDMLALRRSIGYVIQETGLFPHMSIERNVAMALELAGKSESERQGQAAEMLHLVGLADDLLARYPWQLSGGQRQRAGLARALAGEPSVLLLDEPFGALDPLTRIEMQEMLKDLLARVGTTAIMVTHDLDEALYLADRVVFIENGRVLAALSAEAVERSDNAEVQAYVAAARHAR
jgi:osmoprotectant transport system ATP-binding protein